MSYTLHSRFNFYLFQEEFAAEGVDLYDDIGGPTEPSSVPPGVTVSANAVENAAPVVGGDSAANGSGSNGLYHQGGGSLTPNHMGRRYQLYVGNLTWVCLHILLSF